MRSMTMIVGAATLLLGCATVPTGSGSETQLALRVGDERPVFGDVVFLSFSTVDGDSRCPSDAVCVWAGNATTVIGLRQGMGPTNPYRLNTTLDPRSVEPAGYPLEIRLDSLRPNPRSGQPIPQSEYVAYLTVTRR